MQTSTARSLEVICRNGKGGYHPRHRLLQRDSSPRHRCTGDRVECRGQIKTDLTAMCCDDLATTVTGERVAHAEALVLAASRGMAPSQAVLAAAFLEGRKAHLRDRVRYALGGYSLRRNIVNRPMISLLAVAVFCGGCGRREELKMLADTAAQNQASVRKLDAQHGETTKALAALRRATEANSSELKALRAEIRAIADHLAEKATTATREQELDRLLQRGFSLLNQGAYSEGCKAMMAVIAKQPHSRQAAVARGRLVYLGLWGQDWDNMTDEQFTQRIENAEAARSALDNARRQLRVGDPIEAVNLLRQIVAKYADSHEGREAGRILDGLGIGDTELAGEAADELRPKLRARIDAQQKFQRADHLYRDGQLGKAVRIFVAVVRTAPDSPQAFEARERLDRLGMLVEDLTKLSEDEFREMIEPRLAAVAVGLRKIRDARRLAEQGDFVSAAAKAREVVEECEGGRPASEARKMLREWGLANVQITEENKERLNDTVTESMRLARECYRARDLADQRNFFEAAAIFQRIAETQPGSPRGREAVQTLRRWRVWGLANDDANREKVNLLAGAAREASQSLQRARSLLESGNVGEALRLLQTIAEKHGDRDEGNRAGEMLNEYGVAGKELTDEDVSQVQTRVAARREFRRLERALELGRYVEGVKKAQEFARKYPDTPEAREAEDVLRACGAWNVTVTEANEKRIVERLRTFRDERRRGRQGPGR